MSKIKKTIKTIHIDADKCNGCRTCEVVCSAFHSKPKFSSINPAASRIHVITHRLDDIWLPVFAGEYTPVECNGRDKYTIDGKEYDECSFCRAACPSRNLFKEPDTGLPLKCDMCEGEKMPLCVEWCLNDVLIYEEREVEEEEQLELSELDASLDSLINKFGMDQVESAYGRMAHKT
jgi:benzoyl-CoA reductase subunit BamC